MVKQRHAQHAIVDMFLLEARAKRAQSASKTASARNAIWRDAHLVRTKKWSFLMRVSAFQNRAIMMKHLMRLSRPAFHAVLFSINARSVMQLSANTAKTTFCMMESARLAKLSMELGVKDAVPMNAMTALTMNVARKELKLL